MAINASSKLPLAARISPRREGLLRRAVRLASVVLLPLLLTACLTSKTPLFPVAAGTTDLATGKYESWSMKDGKSTKAEGTGTISLDGKIYSAGNDKFILVPSGRDTYIVQYQDKSPKDSTRAYYILTREGDYWNLYGPDCGVLHRAGLAGLFDPPIKGEDASDCAVESPDSLRVVARKMLELQPPTVRYRMVR